MTQSNDYNKEWWFKTQRDIFDRIIRITKAKNADYTGGGDTDNPFANFDAASEHGVDPLVGLTLRMGDKIQRLKAFARTGKLQVSSSGDSIEDVVLDLIGYSAIAIGMIYRRESQRQGYGSHPASPLREIKEGEDLHEYD